MHDDTTNFRGNSLCLDPISVDDAAAVYPLLPTQANNRLWLQTYGRPCEDLDHLRCTFVTHLHDPSLHGKAFSIKKTATKAAVGWVTFKVSNNGNDGGRASCAMFLPPRQRTRHVIEMLFILARRFLEEESSCATLEYWTRTLSDAAGQATGTNSATTVDGILRRQLLVEEPDKVSDLSRVRRAQWPTIRSALEAWLGSGDAGVMNPPHEGLELRAYRASGRASGTDSTHSANFVPIMSGIHSFATFATLALLALTIDALPQLSQVPRHRHHSWQGTQTSSVYATTVDASTAVDQPTTFPTLSVESSHSYLSSTAPYGFTSSGFGPAPTGVFPPGQSASTAPGAASATGSPSWPSPSNASNATNSTSAARKNFPDKFRGVNLGAWLVLEPWMTPDLFEGTEAVDQWTFDATDGAEAKLQQHWSTYITEGDFKNMSSWGINSVRIPIGYWAYNNFGTPYIQGADAYLEKAIGWARQYGMWVMVDCHGSPGSQNGAEHSGHSGAVSWQADDNLDYSIDVLQKIAEKYGSMDYADVVMGIELVNEPKIGDDANSLSTTQWWAEKAYHAVKAKTANPDLYILHHDGFVGAQTWTEVGASLNGNTSYDQAVFALDLHLYQNQDPTSKSLNLTGHIDKACAYVATDLLLPPDTTLPVFIGEFSAQIDIPGCTDGDWTQAQIDGTRQFFEAQINAFEHSTRGWFIWSLKQGSDGGAWSMQGLMENVYRGDKVTERKYPGICPFG
ncbi:hypothetical protein LTR53_006754 [Teratosphaeriaceae sp. CCFEE 6253]|nr:hypothetical protein LTR53_006754 [Teratosphaeriaceae sp. CCFEE 6253]